MLRMSSMRDDDSFRLIDPDEAVALGCFLIALAALQFAAEPTAEPQKPLTRPTCEVTVAQYGPGERWHPRAPQPTCATAGALPDHHLTKPLEEK